MCVKDAHRSLWPELQNGTMFILPRQLAIGDKICFNGSFYSNDKKWFNVRLVTGTNEGPDSQNIPVQINMTFPNGDDSRDEFEINSIVNGRTESFDNSPFPGLNATNLLDTTFSFRFEINDSREINIWLGATPDTVELRHPLETIKYLAITGDPHKIDKLEFIFANT